MTKAPIYSGTTEIYSYDDYGVHGSNTPETFGYTGQMWLPEAGLYYYKARMYSPTLGRFLQTDPIGYDDGMNMYNYVGSDPVNAVDPTGMAACLFEGKWRAQGELTSEAFADLCDAAGGTFSANHIVAIASGSESVDYGIGATAFASTPGVVGLAAGTRVGIGSGIAYREPVSCPSWNWTEIARTTGTTLQFLGDGAVVVGGVVAIINPPAGGTIAGVGKLASVTGTGINIGVDLYEGNAGGLVQSTASLAGGYAGRNVAKYVGNVGVVRKASTGRYHGPTGFISNAEGKRLNDVQKGRENIGTGTGSIASNASCQ